MNKIIMTAVVSFVYFGLMKFECGQKPNFITGMIIVMSSMMFVAFMLALLWVAYKEETEETQEKR
jgi:hypothetical protein